MSTVAEEGDFRVELQAGSVDVHFVKRGNRRLVWPEVMRGLVEEPALRSVLAACLQSVEHEAFFWECKPWPARTLLRQKAFEFVVLPAPRLQRRSVRCDFEAKFTNPKALCATFPNLGGDAELVVPTPDGPRKHFGHLGSWVRAARPAQIEACWTAVGQAAQQWHSRGRTLWLSTSGGGVPWVHVRLDSTPKYYKHAPYRR